MRQAVNILFLGGAKRVSMARMFQQAGLRLGMDVNLFSYELHKEVPVAEVATVVEGLKWNDPDLFADLHNVVTENRIDILVPFVDAAIEIAARYCESDGECYAPCVNHRLAASLFDKIESDGLFRSAGLPVPKSVRELANGEKVIAKPRFGSASKGIKILSKDNASEIDAKEFLLQEYLEGAEEFTVDCFVSKAGDVICAVPRRRLEVVGGEVSSTVTVHDTEIEDLARRVLSSLHLTGAVTLQMLRRAEADGNHRLVLMEINPRLGGGAVCAVHAGADLPGYILAEWAGAPLVKCDNWKAGTLITRYPQEVVFHKE